MYEKMKESPPGNSLQNAEDNDDVILVTAPSAEPLSNPPTRNMGQLSLDNARVLRAVPWYFDTSRLCNSDTNVSNSRNLEKLMRIYHRHILPNVRECYSRPNRSVKLKKNMADSLMFFHLMWSEYKTPLEHSSYLAKMSDLMAMYMDMEIKASRAAIEPLPRIASKLTSAMYLYFGNNYDYALDTLLKSKMISTGYWELCDLIFRRVLRDSPGSSIYLVSYIRYLLVFKMWKGIVKGKDDRTKITRLALLRLKPPPDFREKMLNAGALRDALPRLPISQTDITLFYMRAKFSVREKSETFLKALLDTKIQCTFGRPNFCSNDLFSIIDIQDENETNTCDIWSGMSPENGGLFDGFGVSTLRGMDSKKYKMKSLGKTKIDQSKKRKKIIDVSVDEIGEDDLMVICNKEELPSCIKKEEVLDLEPDIIQPEDDDDDEVNGDTMDIAAEVELSSNSDNAMIKIEPHITNSDETVTVYQDLWNDPNFQQFCNNIQYDYSTNTKGTEYVISEEVVSSNPYNDNVVIPEDQTASIVGEVVLEKVKEDVDNLAMNNFETMEPGHIQELVLVDEGSQESHYNYEVSTNTPSRTKLPLKKRKAFSYNNENCYVTDSKGQISYPSTPMISIAELLKEETRLNPGGVVNSASIPTPRTPDIAIQMVNKSGPISNQNILPGTYNQASFIPNKKVKFKTPAQLKEFQQFSSVMDLMKEQHPVPGAYTTTFLPEEHRVPRTYATKFLPEELPVPGAFTTTFLPGELPVPGLYTTTPHPEEHRVPLTYTTSLPEEHRVPVAYATTFLPAENRVPGAYTTTFLPEEQPEPEVYSTTMFHKKPERKSRKRSSVKRKRK